MTEPAPFRVAVSGGENLGTAVQIAQACADTCLIEEDPVDHARISDFCARYAPDLSVLRAIEDADVVLGAVAPDGDIPAFELTWPSGDRPGFHVHWHTLPRLAEVWGEDKTGMRDKLVRSLDLTCSQTPGTDVPAGLAAFATLVQCLDALLLDGVNPWELDETLEAGGFRTGPFGLLDAIGLDTAVLRHDALFPDHPLLVTRRAVSEGRLGRKAGVGWFRYPGGGGRVEDPLLEDLATEESRFANIVQQEPSAAEATEMLRQTFLSFVDAAPEPSSAHRENRAAIAASILTCPGSFLV